MKLAAPLVMLIPVCAMVGCQDVLSRDDTQALRQQILAAHRREVLAEAQASQVVLKPTHTDSYLEKEPKRVAQLDTISGPHAYDQLALNPGPSLDGKVSTNVRLSLEQAIRMAAANNIDVRVAAIQPAISQAQVVSAEAAFDAVFFANGQFQKTDQPTPARLVSTPTAVGSVQTLISPPLQIQDTATLTTGIRKPLETGGELDISTGVDYFKNKTPTIFTAPNPAYTSNVMVDLKQPLLRNFGTYVNRAQIMINRNAQRRDVLSLHNQLLTTISEAEQAYWNLVLARRSLAIQQKLLEQTIQTRDTVLKRREFDVNPVQVAEAQSFVESRRGQIVQAQQTVRDATDTLKRLINDPSLPISTETLIVPTDEPVEVPVAFNLLDAVTDALRHRPEMRAALLGIDDASIRQAVADNQRLPLLNLEAQMQYSGMSGNPGHSYGNLSDGDFISYLLGGTFEVPIGNRAAEANYRQAKLQRQQAVAVYDRSAQDVVRSVKQALRAQQAAWQRIGLARSERRAAAENLRALLEREREGEALTPEFLLDLKLTTQQRLADAETREMQAIVDYNVGIIKLRQAMGTLLEHDQIVMSWPADMFDDTHAGGPTNPAATPASAVDRINHRQEEPLKK